ATSDLLDLRCLGGFDSLRFLSIDEFDSLTPIEIRLPTELPVVGFLTLAEGIYPKLPEKADNLDILHVLYGEFKAFPKEVLNYKNLRLFVFVNNYKIDCPTSEELKKYLSKLESVDTGCD
ncbi:MAG: hypothetical protein AAF740_06625, partial [Bacteroidota bacterium]